MVTRIYRIEHTDASISEYKTDVLLEHLYEQVDKHENQYNIFDSIIDHRKIDEAISKEIWLQHFSERSKMKGYNNQNLGTKYSMKI